MFCRGKQLEEGKTMKRGIFALIILSLLLLLAIYPSVDASIDVKDCSLCHNTVVSDFKIPLMTRSGQCGSCHERAWHAQWTDPVTKRTSSAIYVPGVGYFKNAGTVNASSTTLHTAHSGNNSYAGRSDCNMCHGVASCTSCHTAVAHKQHSATAFSAPSFYQANGSKYSLTAMSCALSNCHQKMPAVVKTNPDGSELCIKCHPRLGATARDSTGHTQEAIDARHNAPVAGTLSISGVPQTVTCQGCHSNSLSLEHADQGKDCLACHNPASPIPLSVKNVVTSANGDQNRRACSLCHFNANVLLFPTEHQFYHIANASNNLNVVGGPHTNCDTCHSKPLVVNVTVNGTVYQKNLYELARMTPKNYSCLDCHNTQNNLAPKHYAMFDGEPTEVTGLHPGCDTCHTPGTEFVNKVSGIITNLKNGAQTYDCTECHQGDILEKGHLGPLDDKCTQCHSKTLTQDHLKNPITQVNNQSNPLTCGTCHKSTSIEVRLAITTGNTNCSACHDSAHNMNIVPQVPSDIPLYTGYQWSIPEPADIWASEPWMPAGYEGARLVISNRSTSVTGEAVWNYYKQSMAANGWTLPATEPDAASNFFSAEFTKDKRKATIFFYGGEKHTASPLVSTGYRTEILYK